MDPDFFHKGDWLPIIFIKLSIISTPLCNAISFMHQYPISVFSNVILWLICQVPQKSACSYFDWNVIGFMDSLEKNC